MNFAYSTRVRVGIVLILFFALLSSYQLLALNVRFDFNFVGRDEVTENEKRFDKIREALPAHGVVGYWPNGVPTTFEQLQFGNTADLTHWFLTQYALAPVIVSPTPGHELIIGNYPTYVAFELLGQKPTMTGADDGDQVADFGHGLFLLIRERK